MANTLLIDESNQKDESWRYTDLRALRKWVGDAAKAQKTRDAFHAIDGIAGGSATREVVFAEQDQTRTLTYDLSGAVCLAENALDVKVAAGIGATLIEHYCGQTDADAAEKATTRIHLEQGATLKHIKIISGGTARHLAQTRISLDAGAHVSCVHISCARTLTHCDVQAELRGEGASLKLRGLLLGGNKQQADLVCCVTHNAVGTESDQYVKAVLRDASRGVFLGKVIVAPDAQKTKAHQLSRALLLSDKAEMDAKPELEIEADDVACGHGSAVGDLDEEALFYLRARGVPEAEARDILIGAFVREIIDAIEDKDAKKLAASLCGCEGGDDGL